MNGERLSQLVPFEALKLAAGVVLLSPFIPLLFMGEEYGETAPFLYFVSHSEPELVEAVLKGRQEEFAKFQWQGKLPDPQDEATFMRTKLNRYLRGEENNKVLLEFYKELIRLRKETPALACSSKDNINVRGFENYKLLLLHRWQEDSEAIAVFNLNDKQVSVTLPFPIGCWHKSLDSAEKRWRGKGSNIPEQLDSEGEVVLTFGPQVVALFLKEI
jgi:maltooligosyltrehalose trehalohydrolase